jgi:membrane-associated phospholipid phosphatase
VDPRLVVDAETAGYPWRAIAAGAVFAAALAFEIAVFGLSLTPDRFLLVPLAAALVLRRARRFVRDFLPFLLLVLVYEQLRGVAHLLHPHPYYRPQLRAEEMLFGGHIPTVVLQHWLWTGRVHIYDRVIIAFSSTHFFVPPAVAFFFWLKDRALFARFTKSFLTLSFAGALTFLLFPAAPPWAASNAGVIRPIALLTNERASAHLPGGVEVFYRSLLRNPYAAIPSLHAGYALLVFLFVAAAVRGSRWRWPVTVAAALYPLAMGFAVVYTGNHYVVDLLIGFAFAAVAYAGVPTLAHPRRLPSPRPRLVVALVTAIVVMTLAAAAAGEYLAPASIANTLSRSLASAQPGERAVVDLDKLLPFSWSRVYVFPADAQAPAIDRALRFSWRDAPTGAPPDTGNAALLVFVRDGTRRREVVRQFRYTGDGVRMDCIEGQSFARSRARFTIEMRVVAPSLEFRPALLPSGSSTPSAPRTSILSDTCLSPPSLDPQ